MSSCLHPAHDRHLDLCRGTCGVGFPTHGTHLHTYGLKRQAASQQAVAAVHRSGKRLPNAASALGNVGLYERRESERALLDRSRPPVNALRYSNGLQEIAERSGNNEKITRVMDSQLNAFPAAKGDYRGSCVSNCRVQHPTGESRTAQTGESEDNSGQHAKLRAVSRNPPSTRGLDAR